MREPRLALAAGNERRFMLAASTIGIFMVPIYVVFQTLREGVKRRLGGPGRVKQRPAVSTSDSGS